MTDTLQYAVFPIAFGCMGFGFWLGTKIADMGRERTEELCNLLRDPQMEKDAARYRYLRDRWQVQFKEGKFLNLNSVVSEEWGQKIDAAIDAAIDVPSQANDSEPSA